MPVGKHEGLRGGAKPVERIEVGDHLPQHCVHGGVVVHKGLGCPVDQVGSSFVGLGQEPVTEQGIEDGRNPLLTNKMGAGIHGAACPAGANRAAVSIRVSERISSGSVMANSRAMRPPSDRPTR